MSGPIRPATHDACPEPALPARACSRARRVNGPPVARRDQPRGSDGPASPPSLSGRSRNRAEPVRAAEQARRPFATIHLRSNSRHKPGPAVPSPLAQGPGSPPDDPTCPPPACGRGGGGSVRRKLTSPPPAPPASGRGSSDPVRLRDPLARSEGAAHREVDDVADLALAVLAEQDRRGVAPAGVDRPVERRCSSRMLLSRACTVRPNTSLCSTNTPKASARLWNSSPTSASR